MLSNETLPFYEPRDPYKTPLMLEPVTHFPNILSPVVEREINWITRVGQPMSFANYKALVMHLGTGEPARPLNVVKSTYKLVTNYELFDSVETRLITLLGSRTDGVRIRDQAVNFGQQWMREYIFPAVQVKVDDKSSIALRIIVINSYGGSSIRILGGAIDFFCTNGCVRGEYESNYIRHTKGLTFTKFDAIINKICERFDEDHKTFVEWKRKPVSFDQAKKLFADMVSNEALAEALITQTIYEMYDRGSNMWAIYSAMTHYSSHASGAFSMRHTQHDTVARRMLEREEQVQEWTRHPAFMQLVNA